jgi:hypothetical protein
MKLPFIKSRKKKKSPQKNHVFYARENIIQTIPELNKILSKLSDKEIYKTNRKIEFYKHPIGQINEAFLKKQFGDVSFLLEPENGVENSKVYYFKMTSEHLKFLIQVHFYNDEFFMASTKVYGNTLLSPTDKLKVSSTLYNKYCPEKLNDNSDFIVSDEDGNIVFIIDDVFYHIIYLANNKVTEQLRVKYADYFTTQPGQELKETLNDLI